MTCIVGVADRGRVVIGGDSLATSGMFSVTRSDPKVFERDGLIIGFTSSFRMGQVLMHNWSFPKRHADTDVYEFMVTSFVDSIRDAFKDAGVAAMRDGVEECGSFLVGYEGRLFEVESDYQVGENLLGCAACGCGREIALGAVHAATAVGGKTPDEIVTLALEAAQEFSAGVRGPFRVLSIGDTEGSEK